MRDLIRTDQYYTAVDKLLVAVDCIIFGFDKNSLKLLLFQRKVKPFEGEWSLIGSFVKLNENLDDAAQRVLYESTGLRSVYMDQLGSYGDKDRDPGARVISVAYYSLTRLEEHKLASVEAYKARWFDFESLPHLIMDHDLMVRDAVTKLRQKARTQPIGFELLPEKFTLPELRKLYEAIYRRVLDRRNFRKKILSMGVLKKLNEKDKRFSRKGAYFYQFDKAKYRERLVKGFNFEW